MPIKLTMFIDGVSKVAKLLFLTVSKPKKAK